MVGNITKHKQAENYFITTGQMPDKHSRTERWVLHHIDPELKRTDFERYCEWRVEDLIPMTLSEHRRLHMSINIENNDTAKYGRPMSEENKQKVSQLFKGKHKTEEQKKKLSESNKGKHNHNGENNPMFGKCHSSEAKQKMSEKKIGHPKTKGNTGMHWYTDGVINKQAYECPVGFHLGRTIVHVNTEVTEQTA